MHRTRVVNLHHVSDIEQWKRRPDTVYVGRRHPWFGAGSKFANPYKLSSCKSRDECLELYANYLKSSNLVNEIHELRGLELGCWCDPLPCHTHIILKLLGEA